jgi:uncharacterized protein (TIGR02302 family)
MALARATLAWEQIWPAAWPALGIAGAFLALALFDVLPLLPGWLHLAVLILFAAAFLFACWRGVRAWRAPDAYAARRRIETASALAHRPLTAVEDQIASGRETPESVALFEAHKRRMEAALHRVRVGLPAPGLARRDPAALRGALILVLVVAAVIAWPDAGQRVARALSPQIGAPTQAALLRLWIAPPEYTGRPPIYPSASASPAAPGAPAVTASLDVPTGSVLTAQVQNGRGLPRLIVGGAETPFERVDEGVYKAGATITKGDRLAVVQGGRTLGEWKLQVIPDRPPTISIEGTPDATERAALKIPYKAEDDYGLAKTVARLQLKPQPSAEGEAPAKAPEKPLEIDLPLPRPNAKTVTDTTYQDLTTHPWAGLPALLTLTATDGAGQSTDSATMAVTIPERKFNNPVARAIIAQRKKLVLHPEARNEVIAALEDIAARPGTYDDDIVVFLALVSARSRLAYDRENDSLEPVEKLLWDTALRVEDGKMSISEREMHELQQKLMEALARNAPDAEIQQLMRELQDALNQFLQALAEQMMRMPPQAQQMMPFDPNTKFIEGQDLQRMLQRAQELMQMGARDAARDLLAQLQNILQNLQMGRMMNRQQMMQQSQGGEMMRQLQDMIRKQNDLLNQSFKMSRDGGSRKDMQMSAQQQQALRDALAKLRQQIQQMGGDPGGAFEDAERAMGEAQGALGEGRPGDATGPQGEALQALQQAGQGLMQQMMSGMGFGPGWDPDLMGPNPMLQGKRDPLGRPLPEESRGFDSGDVKIPSESDVQKAKRIVEELRRRAGQRSRQPYELDYIERLLHQF